ncbi:MAG: 2,3-bisphosphoglycerate-independent phosphoglycerate mutase [Longimicrobiales bacterium]
MKMFPDMLVEGDGGRIVLLVLDGLGGLPDPETGLTELEAASTPNLDRLARSASLGLHQPVSYGVTPGSGPGHLALFGYDPVEYNIGRGVLSALGVGFDLKPGDIAIRLNLATVDASGNITDRRAGRPSDEENRRIIEKLRAGVKGIGGVQVFFEPEKEHRAVLIMRGRNLSAKLADTDPQETGVPPLPASATEPEAAESAKLLQMVLDTARETLSDEPNANALLARGIDAFHTFPSFFDRFKLRALAIARYPMYRGVASLVGMDTHPIQQTDADSVKALAEQFDKYDFHFVHFKAIDSRGEDSDFAAKAKAISAIDALIPEIEALKPDVLIVTGDHSTPATMGTHSWHPVPILLASKWNRPSADATFGERACQRGDLGTFPAMNIMSLALAHAQRLTKYGA